MRKPEVEPSQASLKDARNMGREAAAQDAWMTPLPEEHLDEGDDLGNISQAHREGWEQTTHFQVYYGDKLSDLTDAEEARIAGDFGVMGTMSRYEGLYVPLKDAFWDAWEEASGFYEAADAALKEQGD